MKKIILAFAIMLQATFLIAQTAVWKEKESFHKVMSATFHPVEEGNFAPLKKMSKSLKSKALLWKNSKAPKDFSKPDIQKSLSQLVELTDKVDQLVEKKASDKALKKAITKAHDKFHEIAEKCTH